MAGQWANALEQLRSYLVQNDEEFELLRTIDKSATNLEKNLEETVSSITTKLARLVGVDVGYVYIFDGNKFRFVFDSKNENAPSLTSEYLMPEELILKDVKDGSLEPRIVRKTDYTTRLAKLFQWSESILYLPLFLSNANCFGMILLGSREKLAIDLLLDDEGMRGFLTTVAHQLSNLITLHHYVGQTGLQTTLTLSFFKQALDPIKCFDTLARQVPKFLPDFGSLKLEPEPEVQILLHESDERVLRIVGSTGTEWRVTRVSVDHSFCGKLITNPNWPFYVDDPHNDPDYKDYLGHEKAKRMQHELAVPIRWEEQIIGILNLESEIPNAFSQKHIQAMQDLCSPKGYPSIAPMVHALKENILLAQYQQLAMSSALDKHLDHVSRVLRHGTATPASVVAANLSILAKALAKDSSDLAQNARSASEEFDSLMKYVDAYRDDIRGFSKFSGHSIKSIINRAIAMTSSRVLEEKNINITFTVREEIVVYCSLLLTQHIFDLINNSLISIEDRLSVNPQVPGKIEITAQLEPDPPDLQEKDLNRRCRVTIWDNGMGVPKDDLAKVGQPEFSTRRDKGGTGFGVFGAKRYIETAAHGVWLPPESVEGEFFKLMFLLDVYNPQIHGRN